MDCNEDYFEFELMKHAQQKFNNILLKFSNKKIIIVHYKDYIHNFSLITQKKYFLI